MSGIWKVYEPPDPRAVVLGCAVFDLVCPHCFMGLVKGAPLLWVRSGKTTIWPLCWACAGDYVRKHFVLQVPGPEKPGPELPGPDSERCG